jgi:hypothetical protein
MFPEYFNILLMIMIALVFVMGAVTFFLGVYKIFARSSGSEVQTVAAQTARLVNKGLTQDLAGIVGQAAELMNNTNQLAQTERGAGVILVVAGFVMMAGSAAFVFFVMQRL